MNIRMFIIACLIGHIIISILVMLYVKTHSGSMPAKDYAKSENAAMSWALGAFTNLAIGIILLLFEYFLMK